MTEATMRNLMALFAAVLVLAVLGSTSCGGEKPGPTPEPTPVVEVTEVPTPAPDPSVATCFTPGAGAPGGGVCKNAGGDMVTCPADTSALPVCP